MAESTITLITGGSRGLGKSMALHIAKGGGDVILTYHSKKDEAAAVIAEIESLGRKAVALQLDVSDSASFPKFVEQVKASLAEVWGREAMDHLVNNAGTGFHAAFAETPEDQFDTMFKIHLKAPFFLSQGLLPLIKDGGKILNVSSGLARFSFPGYSAYGTMKGAVETLTRYMARELGPRKITVNVLAPGAIETDFGGGAVRDNQDLNRMVAAQTAQGRVGLPDDIGGAAAALLLGETGWITGQRVEASGGMLL